MVSAPVLCHFFYSHPFSETADMWSTWLAHSWIPSHFENMDGPQQRFIKRMKKEQEELKGPSEFYNCSPESENLMVCLFTNEAECGWSVEMESRLERTGKSTLMWWCNDCVGRNSLWRRQFPGLYRRWQWLSTFSPKSNPISTDLFVIDDKGSIRDSCVSPECDRWRRGLYVHSKGRLERNLSFDSWR